MNKRIYKHQCKDCDTRFYIEDLKLVSIARCPKCKGKSICFGEHKIEHEERERIKLVLQSKYICLACNHKERVFGKKKDYQEVLLCPQCNGLFVDQYRYIKYEHLKNGQEVIKIAEAAKEHLIKTNLLIIALEEESSVPKVFYKGEEIELKQNISFDWDTDTEFMGGLSYAIEHRVKDKGYPVANRIERRVKGHAT